MERYLKKGGHNYPWIWHYPELERRRARRKYFRDTGSFREFIRENPDIRYFVVNDEVFRMTKNILADYIRVDERRGLVPVKNMPGWKVVMRDEKSRRISCCSSATADGDDAGKCVDTLQPDLNSEAKLAGEGK